MKAAAALLPALLAGCASYQPMTLPDGDRLAREVRELKVDTGAMPDAAMRGHRFDPSDGLDMTEVAMLAVVGNPELKLARAQAGVTRAQAFSAGLLPDPQLSLTREQALGSPAGATVAFGAGLAIDVGALLARSSASGAADAESRKSDLDLLWQEWQTVAKARLLFVRLDALAASRALLQAARAQARQRLDEATRAVDRGLATTDTAAPLLAAFEEASRQAGDVEHQANQARHDLNELLGVAPDVELVLVGASDVAPMTASQVRDALATSTTRRPDLLALQAGFEAQDDRYRGALRAQFPAITIGPTRARDTSDVNTAGFALGITLPLFNRNRGNIAIESATRGKLRAEYQQRLDATAGDAHRLLAEDAIAQRQLAEIDASLPALTQAVDDAERAYASHAIDALALTATESAWTARRLERIAVQQARQEQAIALQALLGTSLLLPHAGEPGTRTP